MWGRARRPLTLSCVAVGAVAVVLGLADGLPGGDGRALAVATLVLVEALALLLLVTGVLWARAGRSPTPGALLALAGVLLLPLTAGAAVLGTGGSGGVLSSLGFASCWVVAALVAARVGDPPAGSVRPPARPPSLDRMPGWLLVRLAAVAVLVGLLVLGGWWAGQAFTLFPSKETPEDLERIRQAGAVQLAVMVLGGAVLALWWAAQLRRRAAAVLAGVAGVVGGLFSVVGFLASLPLFLTAVVLLFLPPRPVPPVPSRV